MGDTLPPFYGTGVKMVGLTPARQKQQKPHMRRWAPAEMFSTGTNTLLDLMHMNCQFPDRTGRHGFWQVPWGKPAVVARRALGAAVPGRAALPAGPFINFAGRGGQGPDDVDEVHAATSTVPFRTGQMLQCGIVTRRRRRRCATGDETLVLRLAAPLLAGLERRVFEQHGA